MTRSLAVLIASLTVVLLIALLVVTARYPGPTQHKISATGTSKGPFTVAARVVASAGTVPTPLPVRSRVHRRNHPLNWDALAQCESSGHWDDNTGNGYYGGTQMDLDFWRTYGGLRFAARPDLASRAQQIRVALNGYRVRGSQPWPTCGWHLGGAR